MGNILYSSSKYLKRTITKMSHEIGSIKYGPGMKYLLNTVQQVQHFASTYLEFRIPIVQHFASKYFKRTFREKSHEIGSIRYVAGMKYLLNMVQQETFEKIRIKLGPSNVVFRCTIYLTSSSRWQSKMFKTDLRKKSHEIRSIICSIYEAQSNGGPSTKVT